MTDESLRAVANVAVAQKILATLSEAEKEAILSNGIKQALGNWETQALCRDAVKDHAGKYVASLLATPEWSSQIKEAVERGLTEYISQVQEATRQAVIRTLHGKDGDSYGRGPGLVLEFLKPKS